MAKRGLGKFSDDLDAAVYSLTLDGGADEEASYGEGAGWYGLMRDGAEIASAIEERRGFAPDEVEGVDEEEIEYLRTEGKAGVILYERSDGLVEAAYYKTKAALDKDWAEVEADCYSGEDEFEENRAPNGSTKYRAGADKYGYLETRTLEPFLKGKGPVFEVEMWPAADVGKGIGRKIGAGYRLIMTEPGKKPVVLFEGEDYGLAPSNELGSDGAFSDLLAFLTTELDEEDTYTADQKRYFAEYAEALSMEAENEFGGEREENPRRNGSARFRVYLNGEVSDTVYFDEGMSESEVKRSLIEHDGYDPRITVKKVEPRRTGIPAEAYIENSGAFSKDADHWFDPLAKDSKRVRDIGGVRELARIAGMSPSSKNFQLFRDKTASVRGHAWAAELRDFIGKIERGEYDREFRRKYGDHSQVAGLFDLFRQAYNYE